LINEWQTNGLPVLDLPWKTEAIDGLNELLAAHSDEELAEKDGLNLHGGWRNDATRREAALILKPRY
jgi:hypothetical protein